MAAISLLIKPVGGMCNMRCRYCFYRDEQEKRSGAECRRMELSTLEAVFKKTLPYAEGRCVIVYQGGEPTLAGLDFFRKAVELEKAYASPRCTPEHAIQTNGLNIDREWAEFFALENILVGVSLDGDKALHDLNRVDAAGKGTHRRVMQAVSLLQASGVQFNTLCVVTNQTCRAAERTYHFFAENGLRWQQYIPCLSPLDCAEPPAWALTPARYGAFLRTQFDCWYRDLMAGTFCYNRYFDNLVGILVGNQPEACDMRGACSPQLVVEADGSVYPCDFYCLDGFRLGNFLTDDLEQIERQREKLRFLTDSAQPAPDCAACPWRLLCRGGCRRHRTASGAPDAPLERSRFCEAYRAFFEYAYPRLCQLAAMVRRSRNGSGPSQNRMESGAHGANR